MIYSKEYVKQQFPHATLIEIKNIPSSTFSVINEAEFVAFVEIVKPSIIFVNEFFVNVSTFKIDTTFECRSGLNPSLFEDKDFVEFIKPKCIAHNDKLQNSILTNIPTKVTVCILYDGGSISYSYENNINPQNLELDSTEALLDIICSLEQKYNKLKEAKHKEELIQIKKQEAMLKNLILSDERFSKCTSQAKRKQYIRQVLLSELGDDYTLLKKYWVLENRGISSNVDWFVEEAWADKTTQ